MAIPPIEMIEQRNKEDNLAEQIASWIDNNKKTSITKRNKGKNDIESIIKKIREVYSAKSKLGPDYASIDHVINSIKGYGIKLNKIPYEITNTLLEIANRMDDTEAITDILKSIEKLDQNIVNDSINKLQNICKLIDILDNTKGERKKRIKHRIMERLNCKNTYITLDELKCAKGKMKQTSETYICLLKKAIDNMSIYDLVYAYDPKLMKNMNGYIESRLLKYANNIEIEEDKEGATLLANIAYNSTYNNRHRHKKDGLETELVISKKTAKQIRKIIEERIETPKLKYPKSALDTYIGMLQIIKDKKMYKKILQNIGKSITKMIYEGMGKKVKMFYECLKNKNMYEKCYGAMGWVGPEDRIPKFIREYSDICDMCISIYDKKRIKSDVLKAIDSTNAFKLIKYIPFL